MAGAGGGGCPAGGNDLQWCFSQVKGAIDEDVAEDAIDGTEDEAIYEDRDSSSDTDEDKLMVGGFDSDEELYEFYDE